MSSDSSARWRKRCARKGGGTRGLARARAIFSPSPGLSQRPPPPMTADAIPQKPPEIRELTVRSVLCGLGVAAIMGASYPYIVLKLGFGPNVSVVSPRSSAISRLALYSRTIIAGKTTWSRPPARRRPRRRSCAFSSPRSTCSRPVPTAGFTSRSADPGVLPGCRRGGVLGVLLAIPMRQHFVVDERLPFA